MLTGKTVILGVCGGIAAYKIANLASMLVKANCDVHVIMTENATNFITPITFETLTKNKCLVDTFDRNFQFHVSHVALAQKTDMMMIAPATANVIGKLANGLADDMLTTTATACRKQIILAPAMNTDMYNNPIVQDNINKLINFGYKIIEPESGFLACRAVGIGKMPSEETLFNYILQEIACEKDLSGKKILVTAGATQEAIDPVRYITNHSTGKMGYAIAQRAALRGADVTLVSGNTSLKPIPFVKTITIVSAEDMYNQVTSLFKQNDIIIKAAAVADYKPISVATEKIKKKNNDDMNIQLTRTNDILAYIGEHKKSNQFICGFSMETENLLENSRDKLKRKNIDMIVANNLKDAGAGFGTDTNIVTIITANNEVKFPIMSKYEVADRILDLISKALTLQ